SIDTQGNRTYFLGRASGVINVGGNKVHPEEVENMVRELPGISDARVSGKSSPILGQIVALEVEASGLKDAEADLLKQRVRDYCRQLLPKYKVPAMISIVSKLPVNAAGKIDRKSA
ncbi:MAG: long-chain fatty acid--CoA ligase, partial [Pseudomonadota bacterium]